MPFINLHNCHPIEPEVILEKRCIKFVWSLYNSNYALYSNILHFSLQNDNSIIHVGENLHYFMHKYDIVNSQWSQNINILYSKVTYLLNVVTALRYKSSMGGEVELHINRLIILIINVHDR